MRFGVNSCIVREITGRGFSFDDLGVEFIELGFDDVKVLTEEGINREVLTNLEGLGIDFTLHSPTSDGRNVSLNLGVYSRMNIRIMKNALRIANALGAEYMVIHGGDIHRSYHLAFVNTLRQIREISLIAGDYGVKLLIENLTDSRVGAFPHELIPFLGKNVGVCFDVGHAFLTAVRYAFPLHEFGLLSSEIKEFHLHDNNGSRDEHLPPGRGIIGIPYMISMIKKVRPKNVVFEIRYYPTPECVLESITELSNPAHLQGSTAPEEVSV